MSTGQCLLCGAADRSPVPAGRRGTLFRCGLCDLVAEDPSLHPSGADVRARYDLHRNGPEDEGYCRFLSRLLAPLSGKLEAGARGLDYGCGPGPAVASLMGKRGFRVDEYDPLYRDDQELLTQVYDFVTCTEVVEHFADPAREWEKLMQRVRPGGWLGVMTEFHLGVTDFERWHYVSDFTHLCFYSERTMRWIADWLGCSLEFPEPGVVLMRRGRKPVSGQGER